MTYKNRRRRLLSRRDSPLRTTIAAVAFLLCCERTLTLTTAPHELYAEPKDYNPRIILDTATLQFDRVGGAARWIVASIAPAPGMGEACVLRTVTQGRQGVDRVTGQEVRPELGFREVGAWVLRTGLEGDVGRDYGTYDWNEPFGSPLRVTRVDLYDIFSDMNRGRREGAGGGTIVCRYDPAEEGRKPFSHVHLIPPLWHETVSVAFEAWRRGEPPFSSTASHDALLPLLSAGSPLTAVAAFRRLLEEGASQDELEQAMLGAQGYLRAVFAYLALRHADEGTSAVGLFEAVIARVDEVQGLRSLVAAMGTVRFFSSERSVLRDVATRLRAVAKARLELLQRRGETAPALGSIFANAERTAKAVPWARQKHPESVVVHCPHCGAPQEGALDFTCRYCKKSMGARRAT